MTLFWTSHFFEKKAMYAFNPNRGKPPGSFEKVNQDPHDFSVILNYEVTGTFGNSKEFLLTLRDGVKIVDKINGVIEKSGHNEEYYALVNKMRREAAEIDKRRKEEWGKQPFKGID